MFIHIFVKTEHILHVKYFLCKIHSHSAVFYLSFSILISTQYVQHIQTDISRMIVV